MFYFHQSQKSQSRLKTILKSKIKKKKKNIVKTLINENYILQKKYVGLSPIHTKSSLLLWNLEWCHRTVLVPHSFIFEKRVALNASPVLWPIVNVPPPMEIRDIRRYITGKITLLLGWLMLPHSQSKLQPPPSCIHCVRELITIYQITHQAGMLRKWPQKHLASK